MSGRSSFFLKTPIGKFFLNKFFKGVAYKKIEFKDYGNTSKLSWHEKHTKEVSPIVEPSKEWLMEVKCSSEAIQILSPSMTIPCSLRGTNIDALHNPQLGLVSC